MRLPRPSTLVWRSLEGFLVIFSVAAAAEEVVEEIINPDSVEVEPMNVP